MNSGHTHNENFCYLIRGTPYEHWANKDDNAWHPQYTIESSIFEDCIDEDGLPDVKVKDNIVIPHGRAPYGMIIKHKFFYGIVM